MSEKFQYEVNIKVSDEVELWMKYIAQWFEENRMNPQFFLPRHGECGSVPVVSFEVVLEIQVGPEARADYKPVLIGTCAEGHKYKAPYSPLGNTPRWT